MQSLQLLGQKPNTSIRLNPTMMVFTRLFSWQSMIKDQIIHLLLNKIARTNLIKTV